MSVRPSEAADDQTIFALASSAGRAAVAVMRLSGARTGSILAALCRRPAPRVAALRTIRAADGEVLDRGLVLWFPGPASYTGEDCAELHLHGSLAVIAAVSDALVTLGARPAEPGEFTRRGFLNGKMDLLEAEAIADLVDAETAGQRRQALRQMGGALSRVYGEWDTRLRKLLAWQEALIDFSDDEVPAEMQDRLVDELAALRGALCRHLADGRAGERLREGLTFVIAGAPNVGKSSLFNTLIGRDAAIVSAVPGTTRDALEARLDLGGVPVTLVDTAGLRAAEDEIEVEGVRRARAHAEGADLVIQVVDAPSTPGPCVPDARILQVTSKIDLGHAHPGSIGVSAQTGAGLADLRNELTRRAAALAPGDGGAALTRARHRAALADAAESLRSAAVACYTDQRAEDLRLALASLGRITGKTNVDDVLDEIFRNFCIGK
jgi:tRNA modification GTPase